MQKRPEENEGIQLPLEPDNYLVDKLPRILSENGAIVLGDFKERGLYMSEKNNLVHKIVSEGRLLVTPSGPVKDLPQLQEFAIELTQRTGAKIVDLGFEYDPGRKVVPIPQIIYGDEVVARVKIRRESFTTVTVINPMLAQEYFGNLTDRKGNGDYQLSVHDYVLRSTVLVYPTVAKGSWLDELMKSDTSGKNTWLKDVRLRAGYLSQKEFDSLISGRRRRFGFR